MVMKNDGRTDSLKRKKYGGGNADAYLEFIVKTLKPIDQKYRTKTKENTLIMGSSLVA
jgi:alpha-glucosidase